MHMHMILVDPNPCEVSVRIILLDLPPSFIPNVSQRSDKDFAAYPRKIALRLGNHVSLVPVNACQLPGKCGAPAHPIRHLYGVL